MRKQFSLLEYAKLIIKKVSFDRKLAEKEYLKATRNLNNNDKKQLRKWVQLELGLDLSKSQFD